MVAVKTSSFVSSCDVNIETDIEVVSAELVTRSKLKDVICCCYRPANAGQSWLENFNSFLEEESPRYINIIICGDFNFPKLHWHFPSATSSGDDFTFTEQLNDFFLTQTTY